MNRHLISPIALFTVTVWFLAAFAPAGAHAAAAPAPPVVKEANRAPSDADDAQTLKVAEAKLAALAKEVESGKPVMQVTEKKAGVKGKAAKKKRKTAGHAKGKKGKGKDGAVAKALVLDRRMTPSEVQGILSGSRDFSGADLRGLNLTGYDLAGVKFNRANLQSAKLERANLSETDLELADLTGADLRGASLNQARIRGTRLAGAKLDGAMWTDKTICRPGSVGTCIE